MAETLEESFLMEDFERSQLESGAAVPNADVNMTTCTCRNFCLKEKGRNFCPCRSIGNFCSSVCHGENSERCMNKRRIQESDSDITSSDSSVCHDEESEDEQPVEKRSRVSSRAGATRRGRARGRGSGGRGRVQRRGCPGARRGSERGCRQGSLVPRPNTVGHQANRDQQLVVRTL